MRFPLLRSLLVPKISVSWERQRGKRNSWSAGASKTRPGCEEAFGVWVMLRSIPASTCPILTLWDSRALLHSVLVVPFIIILHQLTMFKQPQEKKNAHYMSAYEGINIQNIQNNHKPIPSSTWHRAVPAMQLSNICPVQQKIQCSTSRAAHNPPHPPQLYLNFEAVQMQADGASDPTGALGKPGELLLDAEIPPSLRLISIAGAHSKPFQKRCPLCLKHTLGIGQHLLSTKQSVIMVSSPLS